MIPPRRSALVLIAAVAASALSACAYNEALGRNQFLLVDNAALSRQSTQAWREAIAKPGVMTTGAQVDRIRRVGDRLVQTAGLGERTWDYAVFTEASPNAFVLPSGQIGVTTSLLALVRDDDGGGGGGGGVQAVGGGRAVAAHGGAASDPDAAVRLDPPVGRDADRHAAAVYRQPRLELTGIKHKILREDEMAACPRRRGPLENRPRAEMCSLSSAG